MTANDRESGVGLGGREAKRAKFAQSSGRSKTSVIVAAVFGVLVLGGGIGLVVARAGASGTPSTPAAIAVAQGQAAAESTVVAPADAVLDAATPTDGGNPTDGDELTIPVADLADGQARFYSYEAQGTVIQFFTLKSSDGVVRAAFNACDVCYPAHKGYHQEGDEMVCNNCGRRFPSVLVNEVSGGCNPSPLERSVRGDQLVIRVDDLLAGIGYFQ